MGDVQRFRTARVDHLEVLARVSHGCLPDHERVEGSDWSREVFELSFSVRYRAPAAATERGFEAVFNYAPTVRWIRGWGSREATGPIESLCDEVLDHLVGAAAEQGLAILDASVVLVRRDLAGLSIRVSSDWKAAT